jgi:dipeptidyl aminopeptidase/acylaminoacyl peptidase
VEIADRLAGKLLLIHGEMDDQVHRTTRCGWPTG